MEPIEAVFRNGRIETAEPIDFPDGTRLTIVPREPTPDDVDPLDDTPEGIAAWLKAYDALEPFVFTEDERAALEADRIARKEWELAHFDERAEKLRKMWE